MNHVAKDEVRQTVREQYARIAVAESSCCGPSCCAPAVDVAEVGAVMELPTTASLALGYSEGDTASVPEGADLGLGCGNPQAIANLRAGETVLDLGSGGGFDCFLAAAQVGEAGRVIGVDMTPDMVSRARVNAAQGGYSNVEFRLGEIEHLPVADGTVDVIISNCVINLSPDKPAVFAEAYRVLAPGGRLAVSDVVAFAEIPDELRDDPALLTGCIAGAARVADVETMLTAAGFTGVRVQPKFESADFMAAWAPGRNITDYVVSATIEGVKPGV